MTTPDLARILKEEFNFLLNDELALLLAESAIRHIAAIPARCSNIHPHFGQCVYAEHKGDHYYAQPAEG